VLSARLFRGVAGNLLRSGAPTRDLALDVEREDRLVLHRIQQAAGEGFGREQWGHGSGNGAAAKLGRRVKVT
jgi:hypothetical protein